MTRTTPFLLLADGDPEIQEMFVGCFVEMFPDYSVRTVPDGLRVLAFLENCDRASFPRLLIMDYKLPVFSAPKILERLAEDCRYRTFPKVVWNAACRQEDADRCIENGADLYVVKPSNREELRRMIGQIMPLAGSAVLQAF